MSRWFRHYAGMARDAKLVAAALKAGQPVERVLWVWAAILESAAEVNDNGRFELDAAEAAYFLRADADDVSRIVGALEDGGRVSGGRVVKWGDRQFQSDRSADRQQRYRDRQKASRDDENMGGETPRDGGGDGLVTSLSRHGDAPETDTETDTEVATQPVASRKIEIDRLEAELREAAGQENNPAPSLLDLSPIASLLKAGYDLREDVLPKLRAAKASGKKPSTWAYYVRAITEGKSVNAAIPAKATSPPSNTTWLEAGDPRWPELAERHQRERGKPLVAIQSRHFAHPGAALPTEWLEPRPH